MALGATDNSRRLMKKILIGLGIFILSVLLFYIVFLTAFSYEDEISEYNEIVSFLLL